MASEGLANTFRICPGSLQTQIRILLWAVLMAVSSRTVSGMTGKVLLVSFDGFRWDYLDFIPGLTHFQEVAEQGSSAEYMNNTFSTMTFPTHYSMATGLYQENHGIVSNYMWDPKFRENFSPACRECLVQKWWGGEPIWITATKQNKKVGCMFWPGTEVEFDGYYPEIVEEFSNSVPFNERVDTVLGWFTNEDIDFATLYFQEPDKAGHDYGPRSTQVRDRVQEVDETLGYLIDEVKKRELEDLLNIVIVSDHGITNASYERVLEIPSMINMTLVDKFVEVGAICHVFIKEGHCDEVFRELDGLHPNMTAYRRDDVPERWHYSHNRRIGDILLVMDEHWSCAENKEVSWMHALGNHGYDNRLLSMKPIFMAKGPDIKENFEVRPFMSLDIYPLVSALLEITPAPNNGTLNIVGAILKESSVKSPESGAVRSFGTSGTIQTLSARMVCLFLVMVTFRLGQ